LRHDLPVRGWIPTIRHARTDGTPSAISLANASRLAKSGFGPRRPIATPHIHGCCDARQNPPFLGNGTLDIIISVIGVVIFTALTASTVQRISTGQIAAMTGSMEKASVIGALLLYLEFVNIFLFLLRLFGGGGRR